MTILGVHHHDGTVGATATQSGEGYNASGGSPVPVYVSTGFAKTCIRWTTGSPAAANYFQDNGYTNGYFYTMWVRFPSLPTADLCPSYVLDTGSTGLATIVVDSGGHVQIHNALTNTAVATSTSVLTANTWYRLEWNVTTGSTQTLRIYAATGTTPIETLTGACASGTPSKLRVGQPWNGKRGGGTDQVDIDEVYISDAWLGLSGADPTCNAGPDQPSAITGTLVTLDASGSSYTPPDTGITHSWVKTSGPSATLSSSTAVAPTFTPATAGTYVFTDTVTGDATGRTASDSVTITVTTTNSPPTAVFTHSESALTTTIDATGSTDSDGTIVSYDVDWGDGTTHGTSATGSHTYASAGTYTVLLTVTDDGAATGTVSHSVTVAAPPGLALTNLVSGSRVASSVRGVLVAGVLVAAIVREVIGSMDSSTYSDTYSSTY